MPRMRHRRCDSACCGAHYNLCRGARTDVPRCTHKIVLRCKISSALGGNAVFVALRFVSSQAPMRIFQHDSACATLVLTVALQQN